MRSCVSHAEKNKVMKMEIGANSNPTSKIP
jgi:hypothetical protein